MSNPSNANDAKRMARRRLLRGAYAVPAVLTVHTGSALAGASSLACFAKLPTGVAIGPADNFWRVEQYTGKVGGVSTKLVKVSEIATLCDTKSAGTIVKTFLTGKTWLRVSDSASVTPDPLPTPAPAKDGANYWVALRIENTGTATSPVWKVQGVAPSSGLTGAPKVMAQSCWSSFVIG